MDPVESKDGSESSATATAVVPQPVNTDEGVPAVVVVAPIESTTKKTRKKTVTFKNVLETSDDITVKKVYNPSGTPLVPIIKKDSSLRSMESIVKPSRLTEIVKQSSFNNLNRIKTLGFDATDDRDEDDEDEEQQQQPVDKVTSSASVCHPPNNDAPANDEDEVEEAREMGNGAVGDKRFILPKRSLHSRRVIKPNKKFLDDMDGCSAKALKRVNSGSKVNKATSGGAAVKTEVAEGNVIVPATTGKSSSSSSNGIKCDVKEGGGGGVVVEGLKKEKEEKATKEVASLFGQPVSSVGTDLNLTPFGSNKVILRQPRLQFAMPISTTPNATTPTTNLFGFSSSSSGGSIAAITEGGIIGSGSTLSHSVAIPLKTNSLVVNGE